ncbi:MAG TPA: methionine biosynthesis protein MetW [Azospirillaceae bacterium]|nr:methionine biosynthesis protein MetW [Azospirillaceae bacterium]
MDAQAPRTIRPDLRRIADMIEPGARVLDVGCGDGELLEHLVYERRVDGRGVELSMDGVRACVSRGLSVIQGDADTDLADYPDDGFDYVVLSQTLQATRDPRGVLRHLVRIGRRAIVSFPNFGYWRLRWQLMSRGRMPVTDHLGFQWWETPNIHFCTIADFNALSRDLGLVVERSVILDRGGAPVPARADSWLANWVGEQGVFLLRRG